MTKTTCKTILLIVVVIYITGCVATYYPTKQKVSINTQNNESTVYIDNEQVGKGKNVVTKIK
ncbi:MAG TPA: hypothetical protein VFG54_05055, partial [Prolixibacteraceae bacterium]|nr:hypothetical protein [Prolixibacteraceae bacterium]